MWKAAARAAALQAPQAARGHKKGRVFLMVCIKGQRDGAKGSRQTSLRPHQYY